MAVVEFSRWRRQAQAREGTWKAPSHPVPHPNSHTQEKLPLWMLVFLRTVAKVAAKTQHVHYKVKRPTMTPVFVSSSICKYFFHKKTLKKKKKELLPVFGFDGQWEGSQDINRTGMEHPWSSTQKGRWITFFLCHATVKKFSVFSLGLWTLLIISIHWSR